MRSYAHIEGIPITYALDKAFKEGASYKEGLLKTFLIGIFEGEDEILSAIKMLSSEEIRKTIIARAKLKIADPDNKYVYE